MFRFCLSVIIVMIWLSVAAAAQTTVASGAKDNGAMAEVKIVSLRLAALAKELKAGNRTALDGSWQELKDKAPLVNVTGVLRECREESLKKFEESRRRLENYTFKWRKTRRGRSKNGADEHSEVTEVYPPPFRKQRGKWGDKTSVLIEKDGKPVSPERIEKERLKVGRNLQSFEREAGPTTELPVVGLDSMAWFSFGVVLNMFFASKRVDFRGDEFFDKCEFDHPYRENVAGRDAIALRFRPRSNTVFSETAKYLSNFEGVIWVDEADKFIFRLAAWPQGAKFDSNDSDYLLENAAVAIDYTRTKEGLRFRRLGRMNAVKYPKALLWLKEDFSVELFDFKLYKVDSEKEKLSVPEKK